jgi:uncharacterized glyoxalase superfamily protein PhnB
MASETPLCDDAPARPEAEPRGSAARWRHAGAGRGLRAARVRAGSALDRLLSRRKAASAAVMPTVRYRDVPAAIAWLTAAFGMQVHRAVAGEGGAPRYAELRFGGNLLMIAPIEDTPFGRLMVQPDAIGGVETQICYLHVADVALHYARAKAAGAEIVLDIEDEANNGRGYSCRDPEGHLWNFGTYHPWQKPCAGPHGVARDRRRERSGLSVLVLLLLAALVASDPVPPLRVARADTVLAEARAPARAHSPAGLEQAKRAAEERAAEELQERQARANDAALAAAEKTAAEARSQLAEARAAREKAEREAALARAQAEETQSARHAAERDAEKTRALLAAAQQEAKEARAQAAAEQSRRIASENAAARPRGRRVASFRAFRPRPRVWCYDPNRPNVAARRGARLAGFCKS